MNHPERNAIEMTTRIRYREHILMNIYWFGLAFMWNALHPIVLPALLLAYVPESRKNTYLGGMTFAGLLLAMVIQPLSGGLSDRTVSRWGRRRPWMGIGLLFDVFFLAGMALAGGFWGLTTAYILLQIASNIAHGPAQGLIPDLVPATERGVAAGFKNLFDMSGLVLASLATGQLMGSENPVLVFGCIAGVLLLSGLITLGGVREPSVTRTEDRPTTKRAQWHNLWRVDWQQHADYVALLVARFLILWGIYAVQGFAQYFIRDRLAVSNPAAVTGTLMATIGLALTALVFPAGMLSDRLGRKRINVAAGALATVGIALLILARSVASLYVLGGIIGMATGVFLSVNWAWATDLIPSQEAGKYLGLSNLATAGASASSRLAGPLIDIINGIVPGAYLGYPALFALAATSTLLGTVWMARMHRGSIQS